MQIGRDRCGSRFRFSQDEGVASVRNVGQRRPIAHHGPRAGPFRHPHGGRGSPRCSTTASSPSATSTALGHCGRNRPRPRTAAAAAGPPDRPARPAPPICRSPWTTADFHPGPGRRGQPQAPAAGYRFGVELTPPPAAAYGIGSGSAAGPARRLRRLAQHRPAPRPHHRARGVLRASAETPGQVPRPAPAAPAAEVRARPSPPKVKCPMLSSCHEPARDLKQPVVLP